MRSKLHRDELLSNISVKYQPQGYIAMQVFPEVSVKKDSNEFRQYVRDWRLPETRRANKAESNQHDFDVTYSTYSLEKHSLKDLISDDDKDNYDIADLRVETTQNLTDAILRRMEVRTAALFTSTQWSLNVSLAAGFDSNTTTTNPIPYFETAASTVLKQSGFEANFGIITRDTKNAMKNHVSIIDRIKYTSREVTIGMLQGLLGVGNLLEANGVYDNSHKGVADNIVDIWPKHSFVGYKPAKAGPLAPSCGYVFRKNIAEVKRWRDEARDGEWIEVNQKYSPQVIASLAGYLIKGVLS
jgi:hypothetical protein